MLDQRLVDIYNRLNKEGYLKHESDLKEVKEHQLAEILTITIQEIRAAIESNDELRAKHLIDNNETDSEIEAKELLRDLTDKMNNYLEDHGDEYQ